MSAVGGEASAAEEPMAGEVERMGRGGEGDGPLAGHDGEGE